jgi:hypothetical protein
MIKLRFDVDYAYPSRYKSFTYTALKLKNPSKDYLKLSKIISKMINESTKQIQATWFFTPYTIPDAELLTLLTPDKHEVALHVATDPYKELANLEKATNRKVNYYTVHGTARLIARLIWGRKLSQARVPIPEGFPLKSFYDFPTVHLDVICYRNSTAESIQIAQNSIEKGEILHVHPEWLLQRGTFNHRGPYYQTLRALLEVDKEFEGLGIHRKRRFVNVAKYGEQDEYVKDMIHTEEFLVKAKERGADVVTFIERKWCCPISNPSQRWLKASDNIALLKVTPYDEWLTKVGKKTRNMIRKAEKSSIEVQIVEPSEDLAKGIHKIFNETPIRQGRAFSHYGWSLEQTRNLVFNQHDSTFIGAYLDSELVGFIQLVKGDNLTVMAQILSLQQHWDKAVNNALVAKAIEFCASTNIDWLMYGRMGNHPSLDSFKENNGFEKCVLTRYFVPLTRKGHLASAMRLDRSTKDALPEWLKGPLIPFFNWVSRTKLQIRTRRGN